VCHGAYVLGCRFGGWAGLDWVGLGVGTGRVGMGVVGFEGNASGVDEWMEEGDVGGSMDQLISIEVDR
jgi:hypothetical protein